MSTEEQLSRTVQTYQIAAKENPNINVAMLMASALANEKQNVVPAKTKKWAYLISVALPPLGLFYAVKYYFFEDKDDSKQVAYSCIFLTILSLLLIWGTGKLFSSGPGPSIQQIEQIKPIDIQQILQ